MVFTFKESTHNGKKIERSLQIDTRTGEFLFTVITPEEKVQEKVIVDVSALTTIQDVLAAFLQSRKGFERKCKYYTYGKKNDAISFVFPEGSFGIALSQGKRGIKVFLVKNPLDPENRRMISIVLGRIKTAGLLAIVRTALKNLLERDTVNPSGGSETLINGKNTTELSEMFSTPLSID